jgi:hypothetical protein
MINTNEHDDLFPEVQFQRTYSPLRRPQRPGLFQPFPSLSQSLRPVECSYRLQGPHKDHHTIRCLLLDLQIT